jgi:hypothetical protein
VANTVRALISGDCGILLERMNNRRDMDRAVFVSIKSKGLIS